MQSRTARPASEVINQLQAEVRGRVVTPETGDYDTVRTLAIGGMDRRPAAIVRVADAGDVARVVSLARDSGVELAVRSGGHSAAGHGTTEGGIVIDLRDLTSLDIDGSGRSAWAGTGLSAGAYTNQLGGHGLATGFGDTASVGIGGITLGGGVGYLVRKLGMTIDALLAAEIVTADGQVRVVDADHEPDLFWAIRGGGGNFGVATRFRFRLHEVDRITGGILILPATAEHLTAVIAHLSEASEDLSAIVNVMNCPPMPFVAPEHHGRIVIMAIVCHAGPTEAAARELAPLRAIGTPLADLVRPMTYPEIYPPEDQSYRPTAVARNMFVDVVDRPVAQTIVDRLEASDAPMRAVQLRVLGGAMARVPEDATAFAHRASRIMVNVASFYVGDADRAPREAWVTRLAGDLRQGDAGAYVNFVGDEGPDRVHAAYPGRTWDRLAAIKRRYDPTNLFRRNQNIPPILGRMASGTSASDLGERVPTHR